MALSQQYQDAYNQAKASGNTAQIQRYENLAKNMNTSVLPTATPINLSMGKVPTNGNNTITAPTGMPSTVTGGNSMKPSEVVAQALKPNTPTYSPAQTVDNTSKYTEMFEKQKQSTIARIKQAISGQVADQNDIITNAPKRFYDPKNEASFRGAMNEEAVKEQMANMGLAGSGDNITAGVRARASTQGAINNLNQQEQDVITQARNAIAKLRQQEASDIEQATNATDAQMLQAIINEANRVADINRADAKDVYTFNYNANRDNVSDNRYNAEYSDKMKQAELENYIRSITGLGDSFDYQGEINKLTNDGDTSNDYKIPYLQQQRELKVSAQNAAKAAAEKAALEQWKIQQGVAQDWAKVNTSKSSSGGSESGSGQPTNTPTFDGVVDNSPADLYIAREFADLGTFATKTTPEAKQARKESAMRAVSEFDRLGIPDSLQIQLLKKYNLYSALDY